ncbi:hypothetical protein [Ancylomarina longa]|uniref:Uncharacterized protein n=1 Tax=Ancylomarina longa TaxID=2487017 RepID=A0A434AFI4_9BACT|nr:hypothetical protein [Ancylomarina longa]RUT73171.1 hypothetical protein DLK05_14435 [Ancylomarina longa]
MKDLSNKKKESPFKVPEDYFENLADLVQERIKTEKTSKEKKIIPMLKPYLWMAASIFGLVFIAKIILTNAVPSEFRNPKISQTEVSVKDTPNVVSNADSANSIWIKDALSDTSSDEIIEYLSDYDIDSETLLANL